MTEVNSEYTGELLTNVSSVGAAFLQETTTAEQLTALGLGSGTYNDGQLLIGSTATGDFVQSTLTSGTGLTVTNGAGSITLSIGQSVATSSSPTFAGLNLSGLTASQAVVTNASKNLASLAYASANTASSLVQRDGSGNFVAGTITAALTGNASTATILATPRGIYGNNFDGSAALTQIIASTYGGTGNGFTRFSGATTSEKTYTLPNASTTILTTNAAVTVAQGGTGQTTYDDGQLLIGNTTGNTLTKATLTGTANQIIVTNGAGSITLSTPQNIATSSSPTFAGLNLSGLTASQAVVTNASKNLASLAYASANTASSLVQRDGSGNFVAGTITAALTGNASTATILATPRGIYGNNFDGSAALTQIIASTYGGTGNGFTRFSGATTSEKTYTLPNASTTILTTNAAVTLAQGGTNASLTAANGGLVYSTASALAILATANNGTLITSGTGIPSISSTLPNAVQDNITRLGTVSSLTAFTNTALKILDSDATHTLTFTTGSNLTAARTLTINPGDASRTITINGSVTLNDWFDQSVKAAATPVFAGLTVNGDATLTKTTAGATTLLTVSNTNNSNTSSNAQIQATSGGASGGDAVYTATISGITNWSWGIDNSDSDAYVLSNSASLGTANVMKASTDALNLYSNSVYFSGSLENASGSVRLYEAGSVGYLVTGYVGFGNNSSFDVNTIMQAPNAVFNQARCTGWNTYSDRRLKHNIQPYDIGKCLDKTLGLEVVSYWWNKDNGDNFPQFKPRAQIGFIAQQVNQHFWHACARDENNEATAVDYGKISVINTGAIQALHNKIMQLAARIEEQELRLENLAA